MIGNNQLKVFVYGTLKPNGKYYPSYCQGKTIKEEKCWTNGKLYALSLGYPAMIEGNEQVYGFLLTFASVKELNNLDKLEGYSESRNTSKNEYERKRVLVYDQFNEPLAMAWAYLMTLEKVNNLQGIYLPSGCW